MVGRKHESKDACLTLLNSTFLTCDFLISEFCFDLTRERKKSPGCCGNHSANLQTGINTHIRIHVAMPWLCSHGNPTTVFGLANRRYANANRALREHGFSLMLVTNCRQFVAKLGRADLNDESIV